MFLCAQDTQCKMPWSSVAASLLWKWIVGILYLSMPPFGPWNARAYFPIMALSCSQLPREPRCSLHSAFVTPFFTCVCVNGEMRRNEGSECALQCYDEWTLMRDSYYAELIILSLHWGDCQLWPQLFIKAMKYDPAHRVRVCVCLPRGQANRSAVELL